MNTISLDAIKTQQGGVLRGLVCAISFHAVLSPFSPHTEGCVVDSSCDQEMLFA